MNIKKLSQISSLKIEMHSGGVLSLTLSRPERKNALDRELVCAIGEALSAASSDQHVRVIILTGSGDSFCSGADLRTITGATESEVGGRIDEFHRMINAIVAAPQPVIAAVGGPAVGFGADLALACDMRLFSESAYMEEGFIKVGLMPDGGGTFWMKKFVGPRAFEMLALGTRMSASDCLKNNIANSLHPQNQLLDETLTVAQKLAESAPLALTLIKKNLRAVESEALAAALAREKQGQSRLIFSADFEEGVQAFLEKRAANFQGK